MDDMTLKYIKDKLQLVPMKPGCYQMYDESGTIIYVGKAKLLKNRLSSYFTGVHDAKTTQMVSCVKNFEYIITNTEKEAFLLEHNFIKEYRPHYNILLMDDKTYPHIVLTNEINPRVFLTRDISKYKGKKGYKFFGPYPDVSSCRNVLDVIEKVYPFRKCNQIPKTKCIYYDMGQCLGPCINKIVKKDYDYYIDSVSKFLKGTDDEVKDLLNKKMLQASDNLDFEKAIEYKNALESLATVQDKQTMTFNKNESFDAFNYFVKDNQVCVQILHLRDGKLIERTGEVFDIYDNIDDVLLSYLYTFYDSKQVNLPNELLIPYLEDAKILEELLDIKVSVPVKGLKKKLIDLALENASNNLENLVKLRLKKMQRTKEPLIELSDLLAIDYPKVIELFDNSNIQGDSPISAMVTYVDGIPSYKDYRKYHVKTVTGADDFHTMAEVITRRYKRVKEENLRRPNLIIVDGGELQVTACLSILRELDMLDIEVIGLKKDDNHRTNAIIDKRLKEIPLDKHSDLYLLMEAMQDEVHRFAITFFKKEHTKNMYSSPLDSIEGIGKMRKMMLLKNFNSIEEIKNASIEKLQSLGLPMEVIEQLKEKL